MKLLTGKRSDIPNKVMDALGKYRYEVFVKLLGWELDCPVGCELDQFDREDTIYVIAINDDDDIVGCARLLPTTRPYLLKEVFPYLLKGGTPPCSHRIWELSRFSAIDLKNTAYSAKTFFSSKLATDLINFSILSAERLGAKYLISVSPRGVEKLLRRAGIPSSRFGVRSIRNSGPLYVAWIPLAQSMSEGVLEQTHSNSMFSR